MLLETRHEQGSSSYSEENHDAHICHKQAIGRRQCPDRRAGQELFESLEKHEMRMYEQQGGPATAPHKTQARPTPLVVERDDSLNQKESESNIHGMQRGKLQTF
jgi:hypothetical protein